MRASTARTNDDLNAALGMAEAAQTYADGAQPPNIPAPVPVMPTITPTRPNAATDAILADTRARLRRALANYFAGEFEDATRDFQRLSNEMPTNAWIWAFLGASQYSQYAFEADAAYRDAAMQSFRKAKLLRTWKDGLPQKYFSKRIRRVFASAG